MDKMGIKIGKFIEVHHVSRLIANSHPSLSIRATFTPTNQSIDVKNKLLPF